MDSFEIGDLALCVGNDPKGTPHDDSLALLEIGAVYTVEDVIGWPGIAQGLLLREMKSSHPIAMYHSCHFVRLTNPNIALQETTCETKGA
jgi:hypothetical protein